MNRTRVSQRSINQTICREEIEHEYCTLAEGVSVAGRICPSCYGGRKNEGSLSVTRESNTIKFICHRDTCGFRGSIALSGGRALSAVSTSAGERKPERRSYASTRKGPLPEHVAFYIQHYYALNPALCGKGQVQWTEDLSPQDKGRLVMPVFDPDGKVYGFTARKLDDQPGAKTLSFLENSRGCWYRGPDSKTPQLLVVEDQMSALRASSYLNTVALLGTHLTDETLKSIKEKLYPRIYVALDSDALPTAIKLTRRIRDAGVPATVLRLNKDIKNMSEDELLEWLDESKVNWYE